jgi:PST family polysaccharide transporter
MAKLLLPADYGIVGMALVVIGLVNQVAEFGLGAAVVQHRDLSAHTQRRLVGVALLLAVVFASVTAASAPLVAAFYSQAALLLVLPALSVRFLIDAFATVPRAILARDLRFRTLALIEAAESTVMAATGLIVAYLTRSYWALIAANLASGVAFAVLANVNAPVGPRWPGRLGELRPLLTFGRDLVLSRLAWFSFSNADFVVVGRLLGKEALGAYTLAWNIASAPAEKFAGLVLSVAPAILSDAKSQAGEVRRLFLGMVQGVSLVIFPLATGLALVAEPLVLTVLGPAWAPAIGPLRFLALAFILRSLATLEPVVLLARHETYVDRNMMAFFAVVAPIAFMVGSRWGSTGVAASWLLMMPALSLPLQARYVWRRIDVTWGNWLGAVWPGASSAAVMSAVVLAVAAMRPFEDRALTMAVQIVCGAAAYVGMLCLGHSSATETLFRLLRRPTPPIVSEAAVLRTGPI